jgi:hypothetical protein
LNQRFVTFKVNVFVISIKDKQELSTALQKLVRVYPPEVDLSHLKRVKAPQLPDLRYRIVVTRSDAIDQAEIESKLNEINYDKLSVEQVPKHKPLTRPQFERAKSLWPVSFFENK